MAFGSFFNDYQLVSLVVFVALLGVLFCAMPNIDSMHRMPQQCSMSNFYTALPPQISNKILLWFALFISALLIFAYSRLLGHNTVDDSAPHMRIAGTRATIPKIFGFLVENLRRGIIHPKIYNFSPAF